MKYTKIIGKTEPNLAKFEMLHATSTKFLHFESTPLDELLQ